MKNRRRTHNNHIDTKTNKTKQKLTFL
jgi:hypothetical protein